MSISPALRRSRAVLLVAALVPLSCTEESTSVPLEGAEAPGPGAGFSPDVARDEFALDAGPGAPPIGDDAGADAETDEPLADGALPPEDAAASLDCVRATADAYSIFANRCVLCHADNRGQGGFSGVLSARTMVATGRVVPFVPEQSPVYLRVQSGDMPRVGAPLSAPQVGIIGSWIQCGAPPFARELAAERDAGDDTTTDG